MICKNFYVVNIKLNKHRITIQAQIKSKEKPIIRAFSNHKAHRNELLWKVIPLLFYSRNSNLKYSILIKREPYKKQSV